MLIALPSITMLLFLALLSLVASAVLRRPWQKWTAIGCAAVEVISAIILVVAIKS